MNPCRRCPSDISSTRFQRAEAITWESGWNDKKRAESTRETIQKTIGMCLSVSGRGIWPWCVGRIATGPPWRKEPSRYACLWLKIFLGTVVMYVAFVCLCLPCPCPGTLELLHKSCKRLLVCSELLHQAPQIEPMWSHWG